MGAVIAALVGTVNALVMTAAPALAADLPILQLRAQEVEVAGVDAEVRPTNEPWELTVTFTFDQPVDCPADLHWKTGSTLGDSTRRTPICGPGVTGITEVSVPRPVYGAGWQALVPADSGKPGEGVGRASGLVYDHCDPAQYTCVIQTPDFPTPSFGFSVPPAPVWIGIGDGFTSQTIQDVDGCTDPNESLPQVDPSTGERIAFYDMYLVLRDDWGEPIIDEETGDYIYVDESGNPLPEGAQPIGDPDYAVELSMPCRTALDSDNVGVDEGERLGESWVVKGVHALNGRYGIEADWQAKPLVIAANAAKASELSATQLSPMLQALEEHEGSWNWVGLTAGSGDVGLNQAIADYYDTAGVPVAEQYPHIGSELPPWDTQGGECVDLRSVRQAIDSGAAAQAGADLGSLAESVLAQYESVRIVQVLYPYLTDAQGPCAQDNLVDGEVNPGNQQVIEDLNAALSIDDGDQDGIYVVEGTDVYTSSPTGTLNLIPVEQESVDEPPLVFRDWNGSFLQLSRPYGYPYPSPLGASFLGATVVQVVLDTSVNQRPPLVEANYRSADGPDNWYTSDVPIRWSVSRNDGSEIDWVRSAPFAPEAGTSGGAYSSTASIEGDFTYVSRPAYNVDGFFHQRSATLAIDKTSPRVRALVDGRPEANPDGANGWYRTAPVTVSWEFDGADADKKLDADGNPVYATDPMTGQLLEDPNTGEPIPIRVSGIDAASQADSVTLTADGVHAGIVNPDDRMCDRAGNCAVAPVEDIKIDSAPPSVSFARSPATSNAAGWYRNPVTIEWLVNDSLSGLEGVPNPPLSEVVDLDGIYAGDDIERTFCDVAGNCATAAVELNLDQTAPTIDEISGVEAGARYTVDDAPTPACVASDGLSGVDDDGCVVGSVEDDTIGARITRRTVTFQATDKAGNVGFSEPVTYYLYDPTPPVISGAPDRVPDNDPLEERPEQMRWWRSPLSIDWTAGPDPLAVAPPASTPVTDEGETTVTERACTMLANEELGLDDLCATAEVTVRIDSIEPLVRVFVNEETPRAGWYNRTDVQSGLNISWVFDGNDPVPPNEGAVSGLDHSTAISGSIPLIGEGANVPIVLEDGKFCDIAGNCATSAISVKIDQTAPVVSAPVLTGTLGSNGWYTSAVTATWTAFDGLSGLAGSPTISLSSQAGAAGVVVLTPPEVCDVAGNCTTAAPISVQIDPEDPTVTWSGAEDGATYLPTAVPVVTCAVADVTSGPDGACAPVVTRTSTGTGFLYTYTVTVSDLAGRTTVSSIGFTVQGEAGGTGRMTLGGTHVGPQGSVTTSGTLRCGGSPNQLNVKWGSQSFDLEWLHMVTCWKDARYDQGKPNAPLNTYFGAGTGKLGNRRVSIQFTFVDAGEPGRNDVASIIIWSGDEVLLNTAGSLTGGNYQAHAAQGNGTNENGCINGPTGHDPVCNVTPPSGTPAPSEPPVTPAPAGTSGGSGNGGGSPTANDTSSGGGDGAASTACTITSASFTNGSNPANTILVKSSNKAPKSTAFTFRATSSTGCSSMKVSIENFNGSALTHSDSGSVRNWVLTAKVSNAAKFTMGPGQKGSFVGSGGPSFPIVYVVKA